jgi:Family of unknown function (DUF6049)
MTPRRSRARPTVAVAMLIAAIAAGVFSSSDPVGAQGGGRLDLVAQTLYVDEFPVELVLRVGGAPDGARLEITILRTPLLTRDEVRASHEEAPTGGARLSFFDCPLDGDCDQAVVEFGAGGLITVTFEDELIGEALRRNPGALPLIVRLIDDNRDELDSFTTSLLVLDEPIDAEVRVAFVSAVGAPVALQTDQSVRLDIDILLASTDALKARPDLPVTIEVRPETVDALRRLDPERLDTLLGVIGERPLMRTPWVDIDEEAWRLVGESENVIAQYALGNDTLEAITGDSPTGLVRLDPDATVETLGLLRTVGAGAVIVSDDRLSASTRARIGPHPFQLVDDNGVAIPAMRVDGDLQTTLADPDAELGGYRALAELAVTALSAPDDLAIVLDLDEMDPDALDVLLDGIAARPELTTTEIARVFQMDLARTPSGTLVRGALVPTEPAEVTALAAELRTASTSVDTLAAMVAPEEDPITPLRTLLRAAVSSDLTIEEARAYAETVFDAVLAGTSGLEIAAGERITLTDRRTDLPLTVINRQPLPINVELLLSAEKLRFPDGDRLALTLRPGETDLTIPVETLASGDARVTATLISPGGLFELGSGTVDIRSTAISGLGLLISIIALLILGAWWIRTILRVRRNRAAATVSAASTEGES